MTDAVGWHSQIARDFDAKYQTSSSFRERLAVWSALIDEFARGQFDVLDAGCGSGVFAALAARRSRFVLGFDASAEMIELAEARCRAAGLRNTAFRVAALEQPNIFGNSRFDLILCSSVLEYVEDYWRAFDWLVAALKPGGAIILSMPNGDSFWRKGEKVIHSLTGWPRYFAHVRNVPKSAEVRDGLKARGMEVLSMKFYAPTPILSPIARAAGLARHADNLFVIVGRRRAQ
jgi:2-polyprenyl-3-methyl-5-hydroxy-6-metoxy-1,4-benzoquinol methylase